MFHVFYLVVLATGQCKFDRLRHFLTTNSIGCSFCIQIAQPKRILGTPDKINEAFLVHITRVTDRVVS